VFTVTSGEFLSSAPYQIAQISTAMDSTRRMTRSRNGMIAGVCAGIAEYFNLDPTAVRIGYVLLSLLSVGFPGLIAYIILWVIMPEE
jgi:phage shock protein C